MTKKVLSDHHQKKKVLVTPLNNDLNIQKAHHTKDVVPEIVWINMICEKYGLRRTVTIIEALVDGLKSTGISDALINPCIISSYDKLSDNEKVKFLESGKVKAVISEIRDALKGFKKHFPEAPINFMLDDTKCKKNDFVRALKNSLQEILDPRSKQATYAFACVLYSLAYSGRIFINQEESEFDLNNVLEYPNTDKSCEAAASIRASLKAIMLLNEIPKKWSNYFWERCYTLEPCRINNLTNTIP